MDSTVAQKGRKVAERKRIEVQSGRRVAQSRVYQRQHRPKVPVDKTQKLYYTKHSSR